MKITVKQPAVSYELSACSYNSCFHLLQTVGKRSRDIATLLKYVQQQPAYQNLPQDKQDFITRMLTAAENDTVTDFIAVEGYAAVLELIDGKVTQCIF